MKKYIFLILWSGLFSISVEAQNGTTFSQLSNSLEFINPSYAALSKTIDGAIIHRNQWSGVEGAPQLVGLNFRMPFEKAIGLGIKGNYEKSGLRNNTQIGIHADIDIRLGREMWLLFGLQAGMEMLRYRLGEAIVENGTVLEGKYNKNNFIGGYGLTYVWKGLVVGAAHHITFRDEKNQDNIYLHGEYRIQLAEKWRLRPVVLYNYNNDWKNWVEPGLFCTYNELVTVGVSDRIDRQVTCYAELQLLKKVRLSYSYDISTGDLKDFADSSHEIGIKVSF